jgi:hypothetical protein
MIAQRTSKLIVLTAVAGLALLALAPTAMAKPASTARVASSTYPSYAGRFYSVAATSAKDVWAVGLSAAGGQIAHWNGRSWSDQDWVDGYQAVGAQSSTDVWAVGGTSWFYPTQTLARHWNGKTWTLVPTPTPGGSAWFNAVAATSPTNAWAVGCICGGPGAQGYMVPLIEHWNGKTWTQQTFALPKNSAQLTGVAATGPNNAWAVGGSNTSPGTSAIVEHWNGYRWRRVNTPPDVGMLQGSTAIGRDDIWAVGYNDAGPVYKSLILHYNGRRWYAVPSPNPTGQTNLWDVSASSSTNAWAVGFTNPNSGSVGTAAFHWNGKTWTVIPSVSPPGAMLLGVVTISRDDAWAVGTIGWGSTFTEHWNGKAWKT